MKKIARRQNVVLKPRRRKKIAANFFISIAVALILAGIIAERRFIVRALKAAPATITAFCKIKTIETETVPAALKTEIIDASQLKTGDAMLLVRTKKLRELIAGKFAFLKNIEVKKNFFTGKVSISAQERVPVAFITGNGDRLLDDEGIIYTPRSEAGNFEPACSPANGNKKEKLPVFSADIKESEKVSPEIVELLITLGSRFPSLARKPCALSLTDDGQLDLSLDDGSVVHWGSAKFVGEKMARLAQVFEKTAEKFAAPYVADLRYFEDGKIYISKLKKK